MANYSTLKETINNVIKANGNKEITGTNLNQVLIAMVNSLGGGYQFAGVAIPSTNPGSPDQNVFYIATEAGVYSSFNSITLLSGFSILKWNGSWSKNQILIFDDKPKSSSVNPVKSSALFNSFSQLTEQPIYDKNGNVIDKDNITSDNGCYIIFNGNIGINAPCAISDYILIKGAKKITWKGYLPVQPVNVAAIAFYDNNYSFISSISVGQTGDYTSEQSEIICNTIPSNAEYIRCTTYSGAQLGIIISSSNDIMRYLYQEDEKNKTINILTDKNGSPIDISDISQANGIYQYMSGGKLYYGTNAAYAITDYHYIKGALTLHWHGYLRAQNVRILAIAYFNERLEFIGGVQVSTMSEADYSTDQTDINISNIPENAIYARFCTESTTKFYVELDTTLSYEHNRQVIGLIPSLAFDGMENPKLFFPIKETPGLAGILQDFGFIGDSLCSGEIAYTRSNAPSTYLYRDCYPFSWGQRICKAIGGKGVNYSRGGLTTRTWWERYITENTSGWTESGQSSIFGTDVHSSYMIALGTNDYGKDNLPAGSTSDINLSDYTQNNPNTFAGNYGKIIQKIRELNSRSAIFCIIYPSNVMSNAYDSIIKEIAAMFDGVFVIDLRSDLAEAGINCASYVYGGHFTTMGYQFLAYALLSELDKIIRNNFAYFNKYALLNTSAQTSDIIW